MATVFQPSVFQHSVFQTGAAAGLAGACVPVFQRNVFQNNVFQVCVEDDDRARRALEHYRHQWLARRRWEEAEDEDGAWIVLQQ